MSQRRDPVAALRAVVESNKRYVAMTGREMDVVALSPGHAAELLEHIEKLQHPLAEVTHVNLSGCASKEQAEALSKAFKNYAGISLMEAIRKENLVQREEGVAGLTAIEEGLLLRDRFRQAYPELFKFRFEGPYTEMAEELDTPYRHTNTHGCPVKFWICHHRVTTHFPSDGSTYCHDCRKTWTDAEPETHRRVSSVERSG